MAGSSPEQVRKMCQTIGRRVAELCRAQTPKLTRFHLVMRSGLRSEAISRIERGVVDFRISHLLRIAAALKVRPGGLMDQL